MMLTLLHINMTFCKKKTKKKNFVHHKQQHGKEKENIKRKMNVKIGYMFFKKKSKKNLQRRNNQQDHFSKKKKKIIQAFAIKDRLFEIYINEFFF